MKNVLKTLVILLLLFCFLFLIPSAAHVGFAEIIEIPIDAETQLKKNPEAIPLPLESGFISEKEYQDPSISVKIGVGRMFDTDYMTARVKIANATQIRSMMAGTYANSMEVFCDRLVKRTNAVLAINGDYFTKRRNVGVMVRQGKVWYMPKTDRNLAYNKEIQFDILLIDTAGDLHILKSATMEALEPYVGNIVNSFTFGPGLVIDGVKQGNFQNTNNSPQKKTQRMAICQTGPLEYLCICCEGPDDPGSVGMTMDEFAELVASRRPIISTAGLPPPCCSTIRRSTARTVPHAGRLWISCILPPPTSPTNPKAHRNRLLNKPRNRFSGKEMLFSWNRPPCGLSVSGILN